MDKLMTKYRPVFIVLSAIGVISIILFSIAPLLGAY